ncbi:hypothetical protein Cni_G20227 [Canna indica]|uniref:Uncharacterized protein n=1 Tax=Canna indica TaxID=4628 RepID=A0AAQ3KNG0_9LILI|nr:hypothetical protein Cni_G20227 [Canna indica]
MVPARNLLRRHCDSYAAYFSGGDAHFNDPHRLSPLNPNQPMADKSSPAPEDEQHRGRGSVDVVGNDDASTSSDWLRLGLASHPVAPTDRPPERQCTAAEVNLFAGGPSSSSSPMSPIAWPAVSGGFRAPMMGTAMGTMPWASHMREMPPWGTWSPHLAMGARSTMIAPPHVMPEFVARQLTYPMLSSATPSAPEFWPDVRVVSPPRRSQSGVWFMLQAARNQVREPFLPQIRKSYLRIKDGRMTVRLLIKYLVNKLDLADESEVEITCRGQLLLPFFTLQDVRDNIWCSREETTTMALASVDHVMMLQYSRSASN